ncbi:MAG: heavy metal-binding domain-containing protein [bacterium]|nr:heavy metal-binding domain-containing protein [bacterium]
MGVLIYIIGFFLLLIIGYVAGTVNEKNHYKSIINRERKTLELPVINIKKTEYALDPKRKIESAQLVSGSVVVSLDYFKMISASLRGLVGGNVRSYETLIDRGRREAILRMKEVAGSPDIIMNLRVETSSIGRTSSGFGGGSVEVLAYGTAVKYRY